MDAKAGKDTFWENHDDSQHMVGNDQHNTSDNCSPGSKESDTFNLEKEIPKGDNSKEIDSLSILGQHKCQLCPLSFSIRNDLDTHVMNEHTSDPKARNQTCETITMTSASNDKNIKSKTVAIDSFLKIIQICSTGSSKAVDTSNFATGQHKCQMCPLSFSLRDDLDEHVDSVHNQVSDEHKDLRTTQSEKKGKRKYQCLICKVSYCSRSSFKWHLFRSHSMDWRLSGIDWSVELNCNKCPFCSRFLFNFSGLKLHVKKKHPEEDINSLDEIRTKFGEYRNRLKTETVNDQQRGDFEKYTEEEIGIKYKCPACGLFISNFANLKRHMHRRHPNKKNLEKVTVESTRVAVPISDEQAIKESKGIFKCPHCSLLMYSFFSVRRHVETRHPNETQDITLERTRASGQLDQLEKNSKSNKEPKITSSGREKADQSSETEKVDYKSRIQHRCLFCSYISSSFSNVKRHSISWHGDEDLSKLKYRNTKIWPHGSAEKKASDAEPEQDSLILEVKDVDFEKLHLQKIVGEGDGNDVVSDGFKCENISKADEVKQALKKTECVNVSEDNTKSSLKAKLSIVKTRNNLQSNSEDRKTRSSLRRRCKGSSCGKCGEIFKNKFSKFEHECTSVSKQEFVCTECDKYFAHLKSLNHHFKSKHKGRTLSKPSVDESKDKAYVADKLTNSQKGVSQKKRDCLPPRHTKMSSMTDVDETNNETEDMELHLEVFPDMGSENASKMEEKKSEPKKVTDKDIQSLKETTVPVIAETCKKDESKVASIEKASQVKDSEKNSSNRKEVLKRKQEDLGYSALKRIKTEKRNDKFGTKQIGLPSQREKVSSQKLRCSGGKQKAVTMDTKDKDEDYVCPKCCQRFKRMTALKFHMNMKHGDKTLGLSDLSSLSMKEARRAEVKPQKNKSTEEKRANDLNKNSRGVKEKFKKQERQFSEKMVKLESKESGKKQLEMSHASGNFNRKNEMYETDSEKGKPQIDENTTAEQSSYEIHDQTIKSNKSSIDDIAHEISFKRTDGEGIASGEVSQASRKMVKVYKCPFCCAVFMKFAALNHHCKRCHLDEDLSDVNSVSTRHFKFIEELEAEGIKTDQMMSFYKCPFCPLVCDQFPNLSRHAQRRHTDQDLTKVTNASTRIMKSLKDVAETKVGVQFGLPYVFKCPECPSTTNQFIELQSHLLKDHPSQDFSSITAENTKIYKVLQDSIFFPGSTTGQISIYKCPFCSQVCRHYPNLLRHGQRRHKDRDLNLIDRDKTKTKAEAVFTPKEYIPKIKNSGMDDKVELVDSVSAPEIEASQDIDDDGEEEISSSSKMIIRDNKAQKSTKVDTRKTVKCELCGHIVHRQKLEKHLTLYCWNNPKTCNQCGLVFKRGIRLQQHLFVHTGDTPYTCNECGKAYIRSHSLNMHYKKVHANLPKNHKCQNCSKAFLFKSQLTEHERIHDSTDRPICDVCGKSLAGRNSLKRHQMHKHPELFDAQAVQKYSKTLVCHICGLVLKSRGGLKKHLSRTHQDGKELKCNHCSQTFQSAKVYHKHLLHVKHEELRMQSEADKDDESSKQNSILDKDNEDENKRFIPLTSTDRGINQLRDICRRYRIEEKSCSDGLPHKCILCGKRFRKVKYCNLHIRRYHVRDEHKPLRCKVCGAGFVLMNEFKNHARVHTDIRPYQCKICSKRFKQSNHLQDHFKSHKKERCEKCQICGMQFKVRGALSAHVQRHSKIKPYECPHCHQKFVDRGSLTRHLSNYFKDGAVACHICFQKFNFNSGLAKHLDTHILQRPFPCKLCDQNFTCFTSLYYHKVRCNHFLEEDYDDVCKKETKQTNSEKSETMAPENTGEILEATPGTKDRNPDVDAETPETLVRGDSYELNKENSNKETVNADTQQGSNVITDRLQEEVVPSLTSSFLELSTAGVLEEEIGFRYIREEGDEHLLILDADEEYLTEILKKKATYTLIHGTNENSPGIDVPADCENYVSKNIATMEVDESSTSQMAVVNNVSAGEEGEKFVRTSSLSQDKGIDTGSENAVPGVYLEDMVVEVDVHTQTEILDPHTLGSRETDVHTQTEILGPHTLGSSETAQTQTDNVMEQVPLEFGTQKDNIQLVQEEGSVKSLPEDQSRIKTQDLNIIYTDADANTACSVPSEDTLSLSLTDQGYTKNVLTSSYSYIDEEGNTVYVCITETPSNNTGSLDQEVINAAMMVDGECVISSSNQINTIGEIFLSGIEHSYTLTTAAEKKNTQKDTFPQSTKLQNQAKEKHMQDVTCFLDMVDKLEKQETSGGVVPLITGSNFLDNLAEEGDEEGPSQPPIIKKSASSSKSQIGTKSFKCSVCEKSFAKVKYLNLHKKRHIPDDDRAFKCPKCSKGFSRSSELERHINIHSNNRQFVCDICQQSFIQKGHLMTHKLTHTGEKPYQCKYCNQGFTTGSNRKIHELKHSGVTSYECIICKKSFHHRAAWMTHRVSHTKLLQVSKIEEANEVMKDDVQSKFICDICGKVYQSNSGLKLHMDRHQEEKPFSCHICSREYQSKNLLQEHLKIHQKKKSEESIACEFCGKVFQKRASLYSHIKTHKKKVQYRCINCGKEYASTSSYTYHVAKCCMENEDTAS